MPKTSAVPRGSRRREAARGRRGSTLWGLAVLALAQAVVSPPSAIAAAAALAAVTPRDEAGPAAAATAAKAVGGGEQEGAQKADRSTTSSNSSSRDSIDSTAKTGIRLRKGSGKGTPSSLTPPPDRTRHPTILEHLVAGTIGGISGALVSYPLDTVRVRMQTSGKLFGPVHTASLLLKEAGVVGFYRGVCSPMVGTGLIKAAVFGGYGLSQGLARRVTGKASGELELVHLGAAAMGSGLVGSFVVTPIERIKVVMQAAASSSSAAASSVMAGFPRGRGGVYANAWGCARGLVSEHGFARGLYAGLGPTLLREIPGYACYFATYEACKRVLIGREAEKSSRRSVLFRTAVSGALAGIAAWLPVYPVDVVKSRMQSAGGGGGMFATASLLWRTEGFAPFYRGLSPTIVRAMVNHAATFLVYEAAMVFFFSLSEAEERDIALISGAEAERDRA